MRNRTFCAFGMGGVLLLAGAAAAPSNPPAAAPAAAAPAPETAIRSFLRARPGVALSERAGRIHRVYGPAFSGGDTPQASAEAFRTQHAAMFGVPADEIVPVGPFADGRHVQPLMYQPETDSYKFTGLFYSQQRDGVPVFRSTLRLLVRNEPGYPLVLASANLRDLGGLEVAGAAAAGPAAGPAAALAHAEAISLLDGQPQLVSTRRVIWAGVGDMQVAPTLADESIVTVGADKWLILTDAQTGEVLFEEHKVHTIDLAGTVEGRATEGIGAEQCEAEVAMPLPYLHVTSLAGNAVTDADGNFLITDTGAGAVTVTATLDGEWFDVFNFSGAEASEQVTETPPGPAQVLFNADNTDETERAQVNGYLYANVIRDFVLGVIPDYPGVADWPDFTVWVNRTDGFCPGNAWYDGTSINFCLSSGSSPNTAWNSVVFHEYGHHLVEMAGSGQCEYGEGMSDVASLLILDDPNIALGFFGSCSSPLRSADNNCQYSETSCSSNCGGPCHDCGRVISGCVWSTRNNLVVTEPDDYRAILSSLALNSIFLHSGSSITPDITIDFLTLDDDDANIFNGTPHYDEINGGFSDHNMPGPMITPVEFVFPEGLPELISPQGTTTAQVEVLPSGDEPQPGTGRLVADVGGGFVEFPMNEIEPNVYEAVFPAATCGSTVPYYFAVDTVSAGTDTWPVDAPAVTLSTIAGESMTFSFADDFEADLGWAVVNGGLSAGAWERDVPVPLTTCNRGNPGADADGSGSCYLTENDPVDCNSDVDNGSTTLTSPSMDATAGPAFVSYWRWFSNIEGSNPFQDVFTVEISGDGGATWVPLETVGPSGPEVSGGWFRSVFLVADFVEPSTEVQVRFIASDTDPQSVVEAAVDGVEMTIIECEGVFGDLDGDGVVGTTDFLMLLAAWGPCPDPCPPSCPADLDGDCTVGTEDFLLLLASWTS